MKIIDLGKFRVGLMRVKAECGLSGEQVKAIDGLVFNECIVSDTTELTEPLERRIKVLERAYNIACCILSHEFGMNTNSLVEDFLQQAEKELAEEE